MSDVEQFYNAICAKMQIEGNWSTLTPQQQQVFTQGVNHILAVIYKMV